MEKNKVLLNNISYDIDSCSVYDKYVSITFSDGVNVNSLLQDISIFSKIIFLNPYGFICSIQEGYDTIFRCDGNTVIFSNDGSVYDPIIPSVPDEPGTETPPEVELTLEEVRSNKIEEFRKTCESLSENGVIVEIDGVNEHFTYKKSEDQGYIKRLVDLATATGLSVPYHSSDGGNCRLFTPEQIMSIYIAGETNLVHHLTYYNQMRQYINTIENKDEINNMYYGMELTGSYLEAYNIAMDQTNLIINTVLSGVKETQTEETINNGENFKPEETEEIFYKDIVDEDGHIIETVIVSGNSESEELTDSNKTDDLDTGNVDDSTSTPEETINSSNNTDGTSGTSGETQSDENNVAEDVSSDNTTGV